MYHCLDPYPLDRPGDGRKFNAFKNRVDGRAVACGRCENCVKNRKQAWTGKLVAESLTSKSVSFVTLTYAKDPEGEFRYQDVQLFLKNLRAWAWRKHNQTLVRFFAIGENGEEKGRVHWHLVLFFSKPLAVPVPRMNTKSEFWPHGWANVQNLSDPDSIGRSIRYCSSYAVKGLDGKGQRPRCSLKPALGHDWLMGHAERTAKAGLCPTGSYTLAGMVWTRGHKAGQMQQFKIRGSQIAHYITAWNGAWPRYNSREKPTNDWLQAYDDEAISPVFREKGNSRWAVNSAMKLRDTANREGRYVRQLPPAPKEENFWARKLIVSPDGWSAEIAVCYSGPERFSALVQAEGKSFYFEKSVGEVLEIAASDIARLDKWVKLQRGPEWSGEDGKAKEEERAAKQRDQIQRKARRKAAIASACAESRARIASAKGRTIGAAKASGSIAIAAAILAAKRRKESDAAREFARRRNAGGGGA